MPLDLLMGLPLEEATASAAIDAYVVDQRDKAEAAYRTAREHLAAERRNHYVKKESLSYWQNAETLCFTNMERNPQ